MNEADLLKKYQDIISREHILNEEPTFTEVTEDDLNPEAVTEEQLDEDRLTNIVELIKEISQCPSIEKRVDTWTQADGMSALFRTVDGNAYEVTIRQAGQTQHPGLQRKT